MPELPEVEFCRRRLESWLDGHTVKNIWAEDRPPLRAVSPMQLSDYLQGKRLLSIRRHGKQLFLDFGGAHLLWVHLGMTGKWVRLSPDETRRWSRIVVSLDNGDRIAYIDQRRFGGITLKARHDVEHDARVLGMGPDARLIAEDKTRFAALFEGRRQPIKIALMNQKILAGVGNIYASEALFHAQLNPFRPSGQISKKDLHRLAVALIRVLDASLARETGTEIAYMTQGGTNGFDVYGRDGAPCPRCDGKISRASQAARSTFWCTVCQGIQNPITVGPKAET